MNSHEEELLVKDKSQSEIRNELSKMNFEELQKLKEKIGTKVYNATMFNSQKNKYVRTNFKRENKNRPREMSSKNPVSRFREIIPVKKKTARDPRFDTLSGTFNEIAFKNAYSFLSDIKKNDLKSLKKELKKTEDPEDIQKIKFLINRLENKLREEERQKIKEEKKKKEIKEIKEALKNGQKPIILKKSEKKILDLVSQYEDLKKSGKLVKHINRIRKKNLHKDKKCLLKSYCD